MTDTTDQQAVTVAQGDREAAAQFAQAVAELDNPTKFGALAVQAFARHRLNCASPPTAGDVDIQKLVARLGVKHCYVAPSDIAEACRILIRLASVSSASAEGMVDYPAGAKDKAVSAMRDYLSSAGVPLTEFDPEFVVRMMGAMMVSFHKYGRVADAYPLKFDAASDVRARMAKYRETGNRHYLVDAANFAMIEAMHSGRKGGSQWGTNDAADSPGRTTASGHRLVQEKNDGTRIMGETILHIPGDEA